MPEIRFQIQWPDGSQETCYSPSFIVKDYFTPNQDYDLDDFVARSRTALKIASDRVQVKYGKPCGLALGQLQEIEAKSAQYQSGQYKELPPLKVRFVQFIESSESIF
ncbi:MSMEG_0570 family nitrogen starvation response protein [Trichocoleus sp. FACHB-262]|uniref:MSMEG_0570 family nitrogen starvation response protein n=1 Tax=Trichocoleus sp. FACHB-262 TaxID=2692869 RepID=UPI001689FAD3|nr:MSMEG_0570 family nitrogen starvation response protein [Trichocoleus sp. FACHB-262]MBD2121493.1 MSMEG_0570 family nitrogen starvation response protein [Trichocoleus sp. FACHB-262]